MTINRITTHEAMKDKACNKSNACLICSEAGRSALESG